MRLVALLLYAIVNIAVIGALSELRFGGSYLGRLALVLALTFCATLIHELGHALAVRLAGGQIKVILVAPFRLQLKPRRFKLALPAGGGDIGGYVRYALDRINARSKHGLIAAAGPAANILLAIIAGSAALWLSASHPAGQLPLGLPSDPEVGTWLFRRQLSDLAGALATLSAGMAILNLLPFKGSDGDHILFALSARYRRSRTR
jgi:membrane-associated protease RseP (regulator of RpoE activity)